MDTSSSHQRILKQQPNSLMWHYLRRIEMLLKYMFTVRIKYKKNESINDFSNSNSDDEEHKTGTLTSGQVMQTPFSIQVSSFEFPNESIC